MDTKNVIAAITLSSAIIILWSLFMIPDQPPKNQNLNEKNSIRTFNKFTAYDYIYIDWIFFEFIQYGRYVQRFIRVENNRKN